VDSKEFEEELAQKLTEGDMELRDPDETARKRLPVKTEIRIQAAIDPVVEETRQYRQIAKEVDQRYDRYNKLIEE
jgi:23S rRNA A2030 N6-methylase RlmJ